MGTTEAPIRDRQFVARSLREAVARAERYANQANHDAYMIGTLQYLLGSIYGLSWTPTGTSREAFLSLADALEEGDV